MRTLAEISQALRTQLIRQGGTQESLGQAAGLSRQTLSKVLGGRADFRVTTLLALADRLGLEVLLVPKGVAQAMQPEQASQPAIKSLVQRTLENLASHKGDDKK